MNYFAIVLLTISAIWFIISIINRTKRIKLNKVIYRQSMIYFIIKDVIPKELFKKSLGIRQTDKYREATSFRVVFIKDKAYWVLNNVFYTAEAQDGRVVQETIKQVDTINMSNNELTEMLSILDSLKDKDNFDDRGGSGDA